MKHPPGMVPTDSPSATALLPHREGFRPAVLASAVALASLVVAGLLAGLRLHTAPPSPAQAAVRAAERGWLDREAAGRQRLRDDPGDDGARLQLAGALIGRAVLEAQRAYPTERARTAVEAAVLEADSAQAMRTSPQT